MDTPVRISISISIVVVIIIFFSHGKLFFLLSQRKKITHLRRNLWRFVSRLHGSLDPFHVDVMQVLCGEFGAFEREIAKETRARLFVEAFGVVFGRAAYSENGKGGK